MRVSLLLFVATVFVSVAPVFAADAPYADTLTGDWNGARSSLANQGIEFEAGYIGDVVGVVSGGKKRNVTYLDLLEVRATIDGEKLFGVEGNTASIMLINSNGALPNSGAASTQGVDNIEVAVGGVRLYEAWVNQEFLDGKLAVLVGLHDLNSEFAATPMSDSFMKPTMQIGQAFAQSGTNGPSIFPTTSLAGRVRVNPTQNSYVAVAAYDGIPGDPDRTSSSAIKLADKDGLLWVGELGITPENDDWNKLAVGGWHYTKKLDNQVDSSIKDLAQGAYALASHQLYQDAQGRRMGMFLRGGVADGKTAQVSWDYAVGMVASGWARPSSEIGFGVSGAHNSDDYMTSVGGAADRHETSYELYYRDTLAPGIFVQPDVQYVVNPGTDQALDNALVLAARLEISF